MYHSLKENISGISCTFLFQGFTEVLLHIQPRLTQPLSYPDTACEQSVSDVTNSFTEEQQIRKDNSSLRRRSKKCNCLDVSQEERAHIKTAKKNQTLNQDLIFKKDLAYNPKVQMW